MRLLTPDIDSLTSFYDKVRYLIVWRLVLIFTCVFLFLSIIFSQIHLHVFYIYLTVFCLSLFTAIYIYKTGKFLFAYWIFTFSASALVTYSMFTLQETLHYSDIIWIIAIVLFSYIGLGKKWALGFIVFHALSLTYFIVFQLNDHIVLIRPLNITEKIGLSIEIIVGIVVVSYLFRLYLDFKDYSENKLQEFNNELMDQNKIIAAKNNENIILVKEIHHRVKNNLQIVISLLRMQSQEVQSIESKKHFSEAINRIMAISLIHQKLYEEMELSNIRFREYFDDLTKEIKHLHNNRIEIELEFNSNLSEIGLKSIVPLGLLINELITNSLKHAFTSNSSGTIKIYFSTLNEEDIIFQYADSGLWKEDQREHGGFGLELITLLSEQMEGNYQRDGSLYNFTLKNIDQT